MSRLFGFAGWCNIVLWAGGLATGGGCGYGLLSFCLDLLVGLIGWLNWSPEDFPVSSFWISMFLGLLVWLVCGLVVAGCRGGTLCMDLDVSGVGCGVGFRGLILCFVMRGDCGFGYGWTLQLFCLVFWCWLFGVCFPWFLWVGGI